MTTSTRHLPLWLRHLFLPIVFAPVVASLIGCVGTRTTLTVPRCVERVEIEGEHTRQGDDTFVFHHGLDLPLSRTLITVEKTDGTTETVEVMHTIPDMVHLVGAALTGSVSVMLLALYGYQTTVGGEPLLGPSVWALPLGVLGVAFASGLLVTGWHPSSDIVLETGCSEP